MPREDIHRGWDVGVRDRVAPTAEFGVDGIAEEGGRSHPFLPVLVVSLLYLPAVLLLLHGQDPDEIL